jgi:Diacylglycerol acyltransferase
MILPSNPLVDSVLVSYLLVAQPHGAISFAGICSAIFAPEEFRGTLATAVADALLMTPILKHVLGIFGLVSAKKSNLQRILKKRGVDGCVALYVGGIAELFLSCREEEVLYLNDRKGFIKLALTEGVDVIPAYFFGNTSVLSVWKNPFLASASRRFQVSLTYIWGRFGVPIPRDHKVGWSDPSSSRAMAPYHRFAFCALLPHSCCMFEDNHSVYLVLPTPIPHKKILTNGTKSTFLRCADCTKLTKKEYHTTNTKHLKLCRCFSNISLSASTTGTARKQS